MTPSAIYTPLRYPGGKAKLGPFLAGVVKTNRLTDGAYAEPYAGGAGAALFLLFRGYASRVHLNDVDGAVASFWRAVTGTRNEEFARAVEKVPLTLKEWKRQRQVYQQGTRGFDTGFAFFYLNRTNRSGIMNAGVIGGLEQKGEWLMDARFNRGDLARRIRAIGRMRRQITISQDDALDFIDATASEKAQRRLWLYMDPPYYHKGRKLYTNYYVHDDHAAIARRVGRLRLPWLLTYDDCPEVRELYDGCRIYASELSYSARDVRRGREVVVVPERVRLPALKQKSRSHLPGFELID